MCTVLHSGGHHHNGADDVRLGCRRAAGEGGSEGGPTHLVVKGL
ncbi:MULTISPECIES: hypothetical protein [unclassified Streptomyces]|nr:MULTISPECIES: hypothetical protein [unclassified Streptomyces]WNO76775.1 hypothetical protein RPQ07_36385 [Streptomyces sp. AM8-1-1]